MELQEVCVGLEGGQVVLRCDRSPRASGYNRFFFDGVVAFQVATSHVGIRQTARELFGEKAHDDAAGCAFENGALPNRLHRVDLDVDPRRCNSVTRPNRGSGGLRRLYATKVAKENSVRGRTSAHITTSTPRSRLSPAR
jgi:hypothetical protein